MFISDEEFIERFDNKTLNKLQEDSLLDFCYRGQEIDRDRDRRFEDVVWTVVEISGRFFKFEWYEGKTEYQEDYILDLPKEVYKKEKDVIIPEHIQHIIWYEDKK